MPVQSLLLGKGEETPVYDEETIIDYTYDALNRLKKADYEPANTFITRMTRLETALKNVRCSFRTQTRLSLLMRRMRLTA